MRGKRWWRIRPPHCPLSQRQLQCAALIALGYNRNEIAEVLGVAPTTVRTHISDAMVRLHVHTSPELAAHVAVRWLWTPRSGEQHYLDGFDRRLAEVKARQAARPRPDQRQPHYPDLDDLIKLVFESGRPD